MFGPYHFRPHWTSKRWDLYSANYGPKAPLQQTSEENNNSPYILKEIERSFYSLKTVELPEANFTCFGLEAAAELGDTEAPMALDAILKSLDQ